MDETQHEFTPKGALKRPTIKQVCQLIKQSWSTVREDIIVNSFKKCGISNALDGSEDHLFMKRTTMTTKRKKKKVQMTIFRDFKGQFGFTN
jgi:hypothetical protein